MCGANLVVVLLVLHMQKALTGFTIVNPVRLHVWLAGALLFLLTLFVAFSGYVLVSGNMSF